MTLEQLLLPIKSELAEVEQVILTEGATTVPTITQIVQYIIQNGGKRMRPALTLLAAKVAGYAGPAAARVGAAIEMVHTASLLHDDVIDKASTRRGKSSANARWGNQISVLAGDFFWCKACQIIVDLGNQRILRAITEAVVATTEGEVIELTKSNDLGITKDEYLQIIKYKTAMLMAVSCRAGAMLGEVSETLEHALARYGLDLGMAFQLADDALDYDSDEEQFGKAHGTDLREGRLTLPVIATLPHASVSEQAVIKEALLSQTITTEQFTRVIEIVNQYQGITATRQLAQEFADRAKAHLAPFKPTLELESLLQLADYVVMRSV